MRSGLDDTAILLMAYGTPTEESEIEPYLIDIRRGRKSSADQIEDLKRRYREIGGRSPLLEVTKAQAFELQRRLQANEIKVPVYYGMKHWHPYISETVREILKLGAHRIVSLVLAPHYSRLSVGGYRVLLETALASSRDIKIDFVESWYDNPLFQAAMTEKVINGLKGFPQSGEISVLFTAHSLPERIIAEGDPYSSQLLESCRTIAKLACIERWSFAYQSAGRTGEKWLGPDIREVLEGTASNSKVLVVPIGFVADHLEILYDIDVEAQAFAKSRDILLHRTESLNTSRSFIAALADIVSNRLLAQ